MLKLKQVDKSFRDRGDVIHVAKDLSWYVGSGESAALMGESGAGKTTLMNIIAGLDSVDSGEVLVDDVRIDRLNQAELLSLIHI